MSAIASDRVALVVPCYNEARRLAGPRFLAALREYPQLSLVFVNDGSTDGTASVLNALAAQASSRITVVTLSRNQGKAAAVRAGLIGAVQTDASFVGYWDADLSTGFDAVPDFLAVFRLRPEVGAILGSRVQLLGRRIDRNTLRHYLGRAFATLASMVLRLQVYDTQCGAKMFRVSDELRAALAEPFRTRWVFDVELIERWMAARTRTRHAGGEIYELALRSWHDETGSKLRASAMVRAGGDLLLLGARNRVLPRARKSVPAAQVPSETTAPAARAVAATRTGRAA